MARYTGSVCRLCRREGCKLFLKGDRCYSAKCSFTKRPVAPGQHGQYPPEVEGESLRAQVRSDGAGHRLPDAGGLIFISVECLENFVGTKVV